MLILGKIILIMFIEQGILPVNKFWKYIVGSLIVIIASTIGQLPLLFAVMWKYYEKYKSFNINESVLMKTLSRNTTLFLLLLSFAFALFGLYLIVKYLHKQTFLSIITTRKRIDWSRILFSFGVWAIFTIGSTAIMYYSNPEDFKINFDVSKFLILCIIGIVFIPIQTSTEEYVFRGYLMQGFGNLSMNKWFPLVMTSVIFGTMHIANPEVGKMGYIILVYYIGTGFFLGILTLMDEGMELALGFHAANNLIGALLVTSDWTAFQTDSILIDKSDPSAGLEILVPIFIIFPLILFIFSKKYKWTNWKERLTGDIFLSNNDLVENIGYDNNTNSTNV
jgi:uncharacterized protein